MSYRKILKDGIIDENPAFVQVVGCCPAMAVTTSAENGLGMGIATMFVLTFSNLVISLIRKFVPDQVRIPCFVIVISSFVTIVGFILSAFFPGLNRSLGIFIPLIVVNCIILARAESFAFKNAWAASALDGIAMGLGFTLALIFMGSVRELIGAGSVFGMEILPQYIPRTLMLILPPGAFLVYGFSIALFRRVIGKGGAN